MAPALARHLRELPSIENGLSLTQQLTLRALSEKGAMSAVRLFGSYTNDYEPLPFLGDTGYWIVLRALANADEPAIRIDGPANAPNASIAQCDVALTAFGERLLRNEADWLRTNTIERSVGGVRIDSREPSSWRFDHASGRVVRAS
jgi:hypothetical protein